MSTKTPIARFQGRYRFLSNFAETPIMLDLMMWPTVEHYYQAAKTENPLQRARIHRTATPSSAKRIGRMVAQREDWAAVKDTYMLRALEAKFAPMTPLARALISTGTAKLIEGNDWHDTYWGQCTCPIHEGQGLNRLGTLLMDVRQVLIDNPITGYR